MHRNIKIVIIGILGIIGIQQFLLGTGLLRSFTISTTSNEPGLALNSRVFSTSLIHYDYGDFICFNQENSIGKGKSVWVKRLIAKPNDKVEIIEGIVFVNGQNIDKQLRLRHFYLLDIKSLRRLKRDKVSISYEYKDQSTGKTIVDLNDEVAKAYGVENTILTVHKTKINKDIQAIYNEQWNVDHFGPYIVPEGKCFVMGDNRHNSLDSRHLGCTDESDIVGTLILN